MTFNDKAWEILFERHHILHQIEQNGYFIIHAKEIKKEREPRLMAKFDHAKHLPKLFKKHGLSILPVSRSSYMIGKFNAYEEVSYNERLKPKKINFPAAITTIDPTHLYSESAALHCAYLTGMIDDLIGEKAYHTISGRMSSQEFEFDLQMQSGNDEQVTVKNSQIEIDGGYESENEFMLVEAKSKRFKTF